MNTRLGNYLRDAREKAGLTQQLIADEVSKLLPPKKISQALIAQYERGAVILPDATILRSLARLYKIEYSELIFRVGLDVVTKYEEVDDGSLANLAKTRLRLWEQALNRFPSAGGVEGMEEEILDSKADFVGQYEILTVKALAKWQKLVNPLNEFWVITPYFLDDNDPNILDAVLHNLSRHVRYIYFVRDADIKKGGRFQVLHSTLARLAAELRDPLTEQQVYQLIRPIGIDEDDLKWINTDIVIANPLSKCPIGFASIRHEELPLFGYRLGAKDISTIVARMADYAREAPGGNVLSILRATKTKSTSKK